MISAIFISIALRILMQGEFQFVRSVEVDGNMFFSDPMGNVFVAKDNTLKKFNSSNKQAAYYANTYLGNIQSVDVSDPLRILIFYKDHNQIVWVDNFLSEIRSPVWLDELGLDQVELVCSSSQGGFWVFNSLNNQLQYFDVNLKLINESAPLNTITGPDIQPAYMIEKTRSVYLNLPEKGILVFDRFGNYSKTLPVEVPGAFQVTGHFLYFMVEEKFFSYNLRTAELARLEIPLQDQPADITNSVQQKSLDREPIIKAELQPNYLYLYTRKGYSVYKTNH